MRPTERAPRRQLTYERSDTSTSPTARSTPIGGVVSLAREAGLFDLSEVAFATLRVTVSPEEPVTFHMDVPAGTGPQLATWFEGVVDVEHLT